MSAGVGTIEAAAGVMPDAQRLNRAAWATRAQFCALGLLAGAWGVHVPSVKQVYGLDEVQLSVVLLLAATGSVLSLFSAGRLIGVMGARRAAVFAAGLMGLMLALVLHWPSMGWLLPAMLVFGAAMSLFDVAINTEGTALEAMSGRPLMSNLHGMFSLGAMAGAAVAAAMVRAGLSAPVQLALLAGFVIVMAALVSRGMLASHPVPDGHETQSHFAWPRGQLLIIGLMIFAGMSAEGVMYDWSVLYLKQEVGMSQQHAALGYAVFAGTMAAARFGGDALRARFAERDVLRVSAALAAGGMALALASGDPVVSVICYALIGAGVAPVVPILFNAATRVRGTSRAAAIAAVSSIGYAGFMIGPPLIGGIAHAVSLTAAMGVVVVMAGLLAVGARKV